MRRSIKENCSPTPVAIFQFPEGEGRAAIAAFGLKVHNNIQKTHGYHPSNPKFGQISVMARISLIKPLTSRRVSISTRITLSKQAD